jgi:hypothetical protein
LAKQVERDAAATAEQHAAEVVAREADQKAARDARYAARKIRKK